MSDNCQKKKKKKKPLFFRDELRLFEVFRGEFANFIESVPSLV